MQGPRRAKKQLHTINDRVHLDVDEGPLVQIIVPKYSKQAEAEVVRSSSSVKVRLN